MAQWSDRATDDQEIAGFNPTGTVAPLGNIGKAVGPFYLVSKPGEVKYPTQGVNV